VKLRTSDKIALVSAIAGVFACVAAYLALLPQVQRILSPSPTITPAAPTPIGGGTGRIAFQSEDYTDRDIESDIFVIDMNGEFVNLTNHPARDQSPSWSPDGTRIAFASDRDGNFEIYVMNSYGVGATRLTENLESDRYPAWSPDGTRIAFASSTDGKGEIYVMNADGSGLARLTDNPALDTMPTWSPDSARIAFVSFRDGDGEIYMMNADGSGVTRMTERSGHDRGPDWSPDGTRIAYYHGEVYVINLDGSGITRLDSFYAGSMSFPAWSPDGGVIAYSCSGYDYVGICLINADGSGGHLISFESGATCLAWQP
jgi:Tol biopolymer transport system component